MSFNPKWASATATIHYCLSLPTKHTPDVETHMHTRTINYHSSKRRSPSATPYITTHLQHHIPSQSTHKTHTDTTHLTTSTLAARKSSRVHQQYKPTLTHHANNNSQSTKTTDSNITQQPQHLPTNASQS